MKVRKIVRAFLKNKEWKFLMVRHKWKNYWSLPGGGLEGEESLQQAIKRECMEELNLKIKIIWNKIWLDIDHIKELPSPICSYKIKYNEFNWKKVKRLEYIFLSEIKSGEISLQKSEIDEYKFFTLDEILLLETTHIQVKEIIKKAL